MTIERRTTLHIGPLPRRTGIALYIDGGPKIVPLAYFRFEAEARRAMAAIDRLVGWSVDPEWHGWSK